jgi:hypothetical protein
VPRARLARDSASRPQPIAEPPASRTPDRDHRSSHERRHGGNHARPELEAGLRATAPQRAAPRPPCKQACSSPNATRPAWTTSERLGRSVPRASFSRKGAAGHAVASRPSAASFASKRQRGRAWSGCSPHRRWSSIAEALESRAITRCVNVTSCVARARLEFLHEPRQPWEMPPSALSRGEANVLGW